MPMNADRLAAKRRPTANTVVEAPAQPAVAALPAPAPVVVQERTPSTPVQGEPFTGLDPLTRSLVESAPLVPSTPARSETSPPSQPVAQPARRFTLKQPTVLVALGGSLAAGLLVIAGFRGAARRGYPPRTPAVPASVTAPPALPAPAPSVTSSWLIAGGSR